jgi:hypothetical protein
MKKYVFWAAGIILMLASQVRADVTVGNGSADTFETAVKSVATNGGTIFVTMPISIGTASFDGVSNTVVSGGNTNPIFIVSGGDLTLANFTFENGLGTNGGAIYVAADSALTVSNCVFSNNIARGGGGFSTVTTTNGTGTNVSTVILAAQKAASPSTVTSSAPGLGGAIFNLGSAAVLNCQFITNSAIGGDGADATTGANDGVGGNGSEALGGGIYNAGTLALVNSSFSRNSAVGGSGGVGKTGANTLGSGGVGGFAGGAGLYSTNASATVTILNCTFSANTAQGGLSGDGGSTAAGMGRGGRNGGASAGGGVDNSGWMAVTNSTFYKNNAIGGGAGSGGSAGARGGNGGSGGTGTGGGIYNLGTISVVNCTFSLGGAISGTNGAGGSGLVAGSVGRKASSKGGNIANAAKKKNGSFFLMNSIVAAGASGGGSSGTIIDGGFNISADSSIPFKKKGTSKTKLNPLIGDLADNGGPTETIALATNSPAVDKIDPADAPATDQRGVTRPQVVVADLSDIGAYELDKNSVRILVQPQGTNAILGSNVTLSVTAAGAAPLSYQWFFNGTLADGFTNVVAGSFTNSSFTITDVQTNNAGNYFVMVSNSFNSVTSHVATVTVSSITNSAPVITQPPVSQTVLAGSTATFSVTATGTQPLFYQWVFQVSSTTATNIAGATNSVLSLTNVQSQGNFAVTVTNNFGSTNSPLVTLFVTNAPSGGGIIP